MRIDSYTLMGSGFILICLGIASMLVSFTSFYFSYSVTISDVLAIIGVPSLLIGTLLYSIAEGYIDFWVVD